MLISIVISFVLLFIGMVIWSAIDDLRQADEYKAEVNINN